MSAELRRCAWDEKPIPHPGPVLEVVEVFETGLRLEHFFCSHDHLERWAVQVQRDPDPATGLGPW